MFKVYQVSITSSKKRESFNIPIEGFLKAKNKEEKKFLAEHFEGNVKCYVIPKSRLKPLENLDTATRMRLSRVSVVYPFGDTLLRYLPEEKVDEFFTYFEEKQDEFYKEVDRIMEEYDKFVEDFLYGLENLLTNNGHPDKNSVLREAKNSISTKERAMENFSLLFQGKETYYPKDDEVFDYFFVKSLSLADYRAKKVIASIEKNGIVASRTRGLILNSIKDMEVYNISNNERIKELQHNLQEIYDLGGVGENNKKIAREIELKCIQAAQEIDKVEWLFGY